MRLTTFDHGAGAERPIPNAAIPASTHEVFHAQISCQFPATPDDFLASFTASLLRCLSHYCTLNGILPPETTRRREKIVDNAPAVFMALRTLSSQSAECTPGEAFQSKGRRKNKRGLKATIDRIPFETLGLVVPGHTDDAVATGLKVLCELKEALEVRTFHQA